MYRSAMLLALISFGASCAFADFRPALIGNSDHSLPKRVVVPDTTPEGAHYVRCELIIGKSGRVQYSYCYSITESTSNMVERAVQRAAHKARFTPAFEGGKPIRVFMQSTVIVDVNDGVASVSAFPNGGANIKEFGWDYVAPQRVNEFYTYWNDSTMGDAASWWRPSSRIDTWYWMRMNIDSRGRITGSSITSTSGKLSPREVRYLNRSLEKMKFRPGMVDGVPTPMMHIEAARKHK